VPFEIVPAGTNVDFIGRRRICAAISLGLLALSLAAIPWRGIRLGIDFAGGTEVQVRFASGVTASEGAVRGVVTDCGVIEPSVIRYGEGEGEFLIRFGSTAAPDAIGRAVEDGSCPLSPAQVEQLEEVAAAAGEDPTGEMVDRIDYAMSNAIGELSVERVEFVGPRVGDELRRDGVLALSIACALILVYVAFRFTTRFAPGAVVAIVHDVGITAGLFVIFGLEFDLRVLAALLAIIGYSLNDTIIIYDRIRENMELRTKHDLVEVLNHSVNQTLSRTVLTSGTTLAAVLSLLFLGGEVIRPFAIAMAIGIVVGTYSSVFIAAPTLLWLEQRYGGAQAGGTRPAARSERKAKRARA
jgi:preprotein translocase subunit SecF